MPVALRCLAASDLACIPRPLLGLCFMAAARLTPRGRRLAPHGWPLNLRLSSTGSAFVSQPLTGFSAGLHRIRPDYASLCRLPLAGWFLITRPVLRGCCLACGCGVAARLARPPPLAATGIFWADVPHRNRDHRAFGAVRHVHLFFPYNVTDARIALTRRQT